MTAATPRRRPGQPIAVGDTVRLVPTLPTAPSAAYQQPKVTVVELHGHGRLVHRVTVRLPNGAQLTTSARNIRFTDPPPAGAPAPPRHTPRGRLDLADNEREVTLW